jgi:hypothetical protein
MALVITGLVDYIHEREDKLLAKSLFDARTAELIMSEGEVMTGVKWSEKIGILDTDAIFQDGTGCTRTASGTTTITQRQVTVGEIAIVEDICVKTLNKKYLSRQMAKGSDKIDIPFEQEFSDLKAGKIAEQLEIAIWQGDTTSGDANLSKFDGLIKLIDAASDEVLANQPAYTGQAAILATTGITSSNVKAIVNAMWLALPARLQGKDDIRVFCGWDVFYKFVAAFTDQNLFNFAPSGSEVSAANGVVIIPGTNYKLTAVHGLDGTNRLFALRTSNMYLATDLVNEEDKFSLMEDQFKDYLRFKAQFKYGVNVAFPNEVVSFKLNS